MATTTLPPPPELTADDQGRGGTPKFTPRPGHVTASGSHAEKSETGVWVAVAAISMFFAAFTSSMIVRQGVSPDWLHFELPRVMYISTLVLLASSVTLELARRRFTAASDPVGSATAQDRSQVSKGMYWMYVTGGLGFLFVLGQLLAWRNLRAQGLYLATNPSSSFFYVFTGTHAIHLLGGICGVVYVLSRLRKTNGVARKSGFGAFSIYWHFMDILWVYLLLLLVFRF
ncbi:MAG TPA: cytochrome c oxidase subunit 3 [Candidatus Acidoferrales bacterium]